MNRSAGSTLPQSPMYERDPVKRSSTTTMPSSIEGSVKINNSSSTSGMFAQLNEPQIQ